MKTEIREFLTDALGEINFGLRYLCGKPTPVKRFIAVLTLGGLLSIAFAGILVSSIYNIGKNDAKQIYIEHIKSLEMKYSNDSINYLNEKEYEQPAK